MTKKLSFAFALLTGIILSVSAVAWAFFGATAQSNQLASGATLAAAGTGSAGSPTTSTLSLSWGASSNLPTVANGGFYEVFRSTAESTTSSAADVSTFAGSSTLTVQSASTFSSSLKTIEVATSAGGATLSFSTLSGNTFSGVSLMSGSGTLSGVVIQGSRITSGGCANPTTMSCTDQSLSSGTTYFYVVEAAVQNNWVSPPNSPFSGSTIAPPSGSVTFPSNGSWVNASAWNIGCSSHPTAFCGTATAGTFSLSTVKIQVEQTNKSGNNCWNGNSGSTAAFATACGSSAFFTATLSGSSWFKTGPDAAHMPDGTFTISVQITDTASNVTSFSTSFGYDATNPTVSGVHLVNLTTNGLDAVQPGGRYYIIATAGDLTSGVSSVTADVSNVTSGNTAVPMTLCTSSCTIRGTSYDYISGTLTAGSTTGAQNITVTTTDNAANSVTSPNDSVSITNTRPTIGTGNLSISNGAGGGHTAGKPEGGDTIQVTYSTALSIPSICSTWTSSDTSAGTVTNTATVTLTAGSSGASDDSVAVTASGCTLHFGTIDLGRTGYVSGSAGSTLIFTSSTVAWDGTSTLTITLGTLSGSSTGTQGTVSGNQVASYTPDSNITDVAGNSITGTGTSPSNKKLF